MRHIFSAAVAGPAAQADFENSLDEARGLYRLLSCLNDPFSFARVVDDAMLKCEFENTFMAVTFPAAVAQLDVCHRMMQMAVTLPFENILHAHFHATPQQFLSHRIDRISQISDKPEGQVADMLRDMGFKIEEGVVTHHASMMQDYSREILKQHRTIKPGM